MSNESLPRSDARARIGIIGCGNIAPAYVKTLKQFDWIELAGFADGIADRAASFAAEHGGRPMSADEMFADPSIETVVNLTPAAAHAAVTRAGLSAGKAVFSEKPLGIDVDDAVDMLALAEARGVRLGCAPDTFLGAGLQAARAAIDRGVIGEPLAANAFMLGFGPEWWHPNPEIFYGPGAGPLFDMGPYYVTALTNLLGPAARVMGSVRTVTERVIHARGRVGEVVQATSPTHVSALIEFHSGANATLVTSFDVKATRLRNIEIYGSEGTLAVPDPNMFGGPLMVRSILAGDWRELDLPVPNIPQQRGIGLADMLSASRSARPHRASGELALHVLEVMDAILRSAANGARINISTRPDRPAPLDFTLPRNTFD